jgi:hypothetical protein
MSNLFDLNYDRTATAELDGFTLSVSTERDSDHGAPWEEEDGHGPVSGWRRYDSKQPGELVLNRDRDSARFYDFAEACRVARREGWDAKPYNADGRETAKQQAAKAARADFEHLRAWCNDDWYYVGVIVTASRDGIELGRASLWGIADEGDDESASYIGATAEELASEAIREAKAKLATLCDCVA